MGFLNRMEKERVSEGRLSKIRAQRVELGYMLFQTLLRLLI
jgi:hypothetical protein